MNAPHGWYRDPTGRNWYRWWDGTWTQHVSDGRVVRLERRGIRPTFVIGLVLLVPLVLVPMVAFAPIFAVFGDPWPVQRSGVAAAGDDRVVIVNAVCPGDRLTGIELWWYGDDELSEERELWATFGDVALPERVVVGDDLPGMEVEVALREPLPRDGTFVLWVFTDELPNPLVRSAFRRDELSTDGVAYGGELLTVEEFRSTVLAESPCEDPLGLDGSLRFLRWYAIGAALAALSGVVLLIATRER